jgi:hypothetical protein
MRDCLIPIFQIPPFLLKCINPERLPLGAIDPAAQPESNRVGGYLFSEGVISEATPKMHDQCRPSGENFKVLIEEHLLGTPKHGCLMLFYKNPAEDVGRRSVLSPRFPC